MKLHAFSDSSMGSDDSFLQPLSELENTHTHNSSQRRPGDDPSRPKKSTEPIEIIMLPFSEYSTVFPDRMSALQARISSSLKNPACHFLIVDLKRIQYPSRILVDMLRAAAIQLIRDGRYLVLVGNLSGLVPRTGLAELCLTAGSIQAAKALCKE